MKVLIAEDDLTSAFLLSRAIGNLGYESDIARDGAEAWAKIESDDPSLVISDWMMPYVDGPELCRRIRNRSTEKPYIYTILLTSKAQREDRLEALEAGADDFLTKPFDRVELAARLKVAQRIFSIQHELRERALQLEILKAQLEHRNIQLAEQATTDGLTGLKNHRHFREVLEGSFSLAEQHRSPLSVIMVDVDQFKPFNDTFGHPAGDEVLVTVAKALGASARVHDLVARYGGEEFVLLLRATDAAAARSLADRLRLAIEKLPWTRRPITASFGISTTTPATLAASQLVDEADQALYYSKQTGRNRVTHHEDLKRVGNIE